MAALLLAGACSPGPPEVFQNLGACLRPAAPGSPGGASLAALVDRADVIVHATVLRTEPTGVPGMYDDHGARRVTLRTVQSVKGAAPPEFAVLDGPCPMLVATPGESFIALLEPDPESKSLRPIGLPSSALRATPARTLAQLLTELSAIRPLDGDARAIFERNGWTVTAKRDVREFDIPRLAEFRLAGREIRGAAPDITEPFERYAALSSDSGLDPRPHAGQPAELLTFWLERRPPGFVEGAPFGHALIAQRRLIGAWVTVFPDSVPFSVRDRAGALAAPPARRSFPPPNRVPEGIDLALAYDLTSTRTIVFKTGAGGSGEISDPAVIRAFVEALGGHVSTTQAAWDPSTTPATSYYLHFESATRTFSPVYDSREGVLTVAADGFSVKPGERFTALIAKLR